MVFRVVEVIEAVVGDAGWRCWKDTKPAPHGGRYGSRWVLETVRPMEFIGIMTGDAGWWAVPTPLRRPLGRREALGLAGRPWTPDGVASAYVIPGGSSWSCYGARVAALGDQ